MTSTGSPLRHTVISGRRPIASSTMACWREVVDAMGSPRDGYNDVTDP